MVVVRRALTMIWIKGAAAGSGSMAGGDAAVSTIAAGHPAPMPRLLSLFAAEPYRLLFAVGLLHIAAAMALWIPTALAGWEQGPVAAVHLALVVHGFQACFVVGFLATFAPRVMGAPVTGPGWSFGLTALAVLGAVAIACGGTGLLPWILLVLHAAAAAFVARCALLGQRLPPAPFAAVVLGFVAALIADLIAVVDGGLGLLPYWLVLTGERLQLQGVLLLMVCGLAPILLPRFAGMGAAGPEGCPLGGRRIGALVWIAGGAILLSYPWAAASEHGGWSFRGACALRAAGAAVMLRPAIHLPLRVPPFINAARVALISIVLGLALTAILPQWRIAWQHLVFVTGFLWLTLLVGAKVLTAHGGRGEAYQRSRWLVWTWSALLILANLTRVGAEWAPRTRELHFWLGAALGLAALVVWAWAYLPLLWRAPRRT